MNDIQNQESLLYLLLCECELFIKTCQELEQTRMLMLELGAALLAQIGGDQLE